MILGKKKFSKNSSKRLSAQSQILAIISLLGILLCFSCNKPDGPYYNYENQVHIYQGSTLDFLRAQSGVYDSLLLVLDRLPDIKDSIDQAEVTFVAATNKSFEIAIKNLNALRNVQHKAPLSLSQVDVAELDTIMARYVLRGKITTEDVADYVDGVEARGIKYGNMMNLQYKITSADGAELSGPQLLYISDMKGSAYTSNWVRSTTASVNLYTDNGILHSLVPSHEFGFGEFSIRLNK